MTISSFLLVFLLCKILLPAKRTAEGKYLITETTLTKAGVVCQLFNLTIIIKSLGNTFFFQMFIHVNCGSSPVKLIPILYAHVQLKVSVAFAGMDLITLPSQCWLAIEQFPIEWCKTITNIITPANRNRCEQHNKPIKI